MGPNVKKLIIRKMSKDAIPDGGGFEDGLAFLMNQDALTKTARHATEWVQKAIDAVKAAPDNPYGDDDEMIAEAILDEIETMKEKQ
jgi:hypothetical protein